MKQRLFTVAAGIIALITGVVWVAQGLPHQEENLLPTATASRPAVTAATPTPSPSPVGSITTPPQQRKLYSYAIATTDLQGLSPKAAPGTQLDLWVSLQPPITEKEDVQPLLKGAILAEIVPPFLPDGPHAAILQVPLRDVRRLMWADRFGSLSVLEGPEIP